MIYPIGHTARRMKYKGLSFYHPFAFWMGCSAIVAGVLSHIPMFLHAAPMGFHMAGMPMSTTMLVGMAFIPLGLILSGYGLTPRLNQLAKSDASQLHFHVADGIPLNCEHWKLIFALFVAVVVDVMKPATLGFVMPGMTVEYLISNQAVGTLVLVAMTGTTVGSVLWGRISDIFGRRAAIILSALMFIGTAICGAMPSFNWNLVMCFLMGLSAGGLLPITFTLMAESVPSAHRGWLLVALGGFGTAAGYLAAAGSAALLEPIFSWRSLWLLGLPTGLLIIGLNHYIPESPRYLMRKGLKQEARAVLARFSGDSTSRDDGVVIEVVPDEKKGALQLLGNPYSGITAGLMAGGAAWGIVNFGFLLWLPTNLRTLGFGHHADTLIAQSAFIALPCVALAIFLYYRWSSINALVAFLLFNGISLLMFCSLSWFNIQSASAFFIATSFLLMSASGVIAMLIPYAAEIYPVHLRGTGAGLIAASSKFGGIIGATLGLLGLFNNMEHAALILACLLFLSALLLLKNGIDTRGLRLEEIQASIRTNAAPKNNTVKGIDADELVINEPSSPTCYLDPEDLK